MNGQLVLLQWADCAVKNLGLDYFFRCAGIVIETALYVLSKRCNFGMIRTCQGDCCAKEKQRKSPI